MSTPLSEITGIRGEGGGVGIGGGGGSSDGTLVVESFGTIPIESIIRMLNPSAISSDEPTITVAQTTTSTTKAATTDDWNNNWGDDDEEGEDDNEEDDNEPPLSSSSEKGKGQTAATLSDFLASLSFQSTHLAFASTESFVILSCTASSQASLTGFGSCANDSSYGIITAIRFVSILIPSPMKSKPPGIRDCLVVGYSSGYIRIFDESGNLLISQLLHTTPVRSIKFRSIPSARSDAEGEDELTILYAYNTCVSIRGNSLWIALRMALSGSSIGQSTFDDGSGSSNTSLEFQKIALMTQEDVLDVWSTGPSPVVGSHSSIFSQLGGGSAASTPLYKTRYIGVGLRPMLSAYATTEEGQSQFSLTDMVLGNQTVSAVTNAVLGFAKSWWGGSSTSVAAPITEDPVAEQLRKQREQASIPAQPIPAIVSLNDPNRTFQTIYAAPPLPTKYIHHLFKSQQRLLPASAFNPRLQFGKPSLAVSTDTLGRVLVIDLDECEIVRMLKGIRGAQCGWIQQLVYEESSISQHSKENASTPSLRVELYLVVYAARGVLEVTKMRFASKSSVKKTTFVTQIGQGCKVVSSQTGVLGSKYFPELNDVKKGVEDVVKCWVLKPDGSIKNLRV